VRVFNFLKLVGIILFLNTEKKIICPYSLHACVGMWGVKLHQRRDLIEGLTRAMILAGQDQQKSTDQTLLDKIVWPSAQYDVVREYTLFINYT
jgi:hypothetical protein